MVANQVLAEDLVLVLGQQARMQRGGDTWNFPVPYDKLAVRYRGWSVGSLSDAKRLLSDARVLLRGAICSLVMRDVLKVFFCCGGQAQQPGGGAERGGSWCAGDHVGRGDVRAGGRRRLPDRLGPGGH